MAQQLVLEDFRREEFNGAAAIEAAFALWLDAVNSRDADAISALYHDDAILQATLNPVTCKDPAAIRDYFDNLTSFEGLSCKLEESEIRMLGGVALHAGRYRFSFFDETGAAITFPARFSFTYIADEGGWQILCHHSSRLNEP